MKRRVTVSILTALTLGLLIAFPPVVHGQSGGYDLTWSTVDNGGGTSLGGGYALNGTIGQADAGVASRGGGYALVGGFWGGEGGSVFHIYLPLVLR